MRRPRHIDDQDGIILHEDPKEDEANKRDYFFICKVLVPILLLYIGVAFQMSETCKQFLRYVSIYFGLGLFFIWTFTEYYYHRFILHRENEIDPDGEPTPELNVFIFSRHIHHHVFMNQWYRIPI